MSVLIAPILLLLFDCTLAAVTRPTLSFTPNFLIIVVDNFEYTTYWDHSYPEGTTLDHDKVVSYLDVHLPTIESFIDESIVFPRSYANPLSTVSRFSLLTGRQAVKSQYSISQTLSSAASGTQDLTLTDGVSATAFATKLHGTDDITNNIPYVLKNYGGYETGMIGKWHLLSADNNGRAALSCDTLNSHSNPEKYSLCSNILKDHGFDFINGFYPGNIDPAAPEFSHNPEWMVAMANNFIASAVSADTPFYLHFAHTLTHLPDIWDDTLLKFPDASLTPNGALNGDALLARSGMSSRADIASRARSNSDASSGIFPKDIAGALWVDDSVAALIQILKDEGVYDETFVVLMNDQGVGVEGSLYEQGTRIFQFIRFPPYFDTNAHNGTIVAPDNYIVSNMDLAAVLFDMADIDEADVYDMDGVSWIDDVLEGVLQTGDGWLANPSCCEYRFSDIDNSHSIVSKNWRYIYRANSALQNKGIAWKYANAYDVEQLYNLNTDPNEQDNQINNAALIGTINGFQELMREYITESCVELNVVCKMPDISSFAQQQQQQHVAAYISVLVTLASLLVLAGLAFLIVFIFKKYRGRYSAVKEGAVSSTKVATPFISESSWLLSK